VHLGIREPEIGEGALTPAEAQAIAKAIARLPELMPAP
jgi:hypothetical protein